MILPKMCSLLSLLLPVMMVMMAFVMKTEAAVDDAGLNDVFLEAMGTVSVGQVVPDAHESGLNQSCFDPTNRYSKLKMCLRSQCVSGDDVAELYGVTSEQELGAQNLSAMSAGLVYVLTQSQSCSSDVNDDHVPPTEAAVWGYGFLFVTLINICSTFGACMMPCINAGVYKVMLLFMVALAVGTLVGSGLLVLIPEAMELTTTAEDHDYVWKATTVMGGVYLFFLVERIMRMVNNWRENTKEKKDSNKQATEGTYTSFFQMNPPENPSAMLKNPAHLPRGLGHDVPGHAHHGIANCAFAVEDDQSRQSSGDLAVLAEVGNGNLQDGPEASNPATPNTSGRSGSGGGGASTSSPEDPSGAEDEEEKRVKIAPVAYMIIFGDALHNLIDGLSIGAAFTESTLLGISLSVAVMCEELPHELGDFAILLNSGMSMRKALLYNLLSSLTCYVGLVIGIQLGENTSANTWIFAIAGGMFLYISLADMLPEMNSAAESKDGQEFGEIKTFLVQNLGLLIGFGIILLLAVYGERINFE